MLIPLNWLREYVKDGLSSDELAEKLTASGSSVERIVTIGQGLDDLIVGLVEAVRPHPNADRLRLATVNTGKASVEVVCGAHNLEAGQHIVYASEGAHIPVDMHDEQRRPFVLKMATIRGVESNGMICSVAEMGLGEDHDGILVLPETTIVGQKITEALNYPQIVFDVEVTTNRSDELSIIGVAREVSALTGLNLDLPTIKAPVVVNKSNDYEPSIQSPSCYRLITQQLRVSVGPSPWWMQQRLSLAGMRPINNIVDITNYVMLEYGQPLHAYDAKLLTGKHLVARQAKAGEKLTTLDGVERTLTPDMLVIADDTQALGIAGIMGGAASKTTAETTEIVLEAAAFDPINIRKTANHLALRSEASRRFERSVDREMTATALDRAVDLLVKYANAQVLSPAKDSYPAPFESKQVTLHSGKLNQYLGQLADPGQVRQILKSLGFGDASAYGNDTDWEIAVRVPSWRANDIQEEVDLIEEVVRMVGYDQIPTALPEGELPVEPAPQAYQQRLKLRRTMAQAGWTEIISVSLIGESLMQQLHLPLPPIKLSNPLSSEWTHLRSSIVPNLIESAAKNIRWSSTLRLFELGATYQPGVASLPREEIRLGLLLCSNQTPEFAMAEIKGIIEHSLKQLGVRTNQVQYRAIDTNETPFKANQAAEVVVDRKKIGQVGLIPESIRESLRLPESSLVAELTIDSLLTTPQPYQFRALPAFPSLEEDISVIAPESVGVAEVLATIQQAGGQLLESAILTQIYRSPKLGDKVKSLTFHLVYRSQEATLSSKEVGQIRQKIATSLEKEDLHVRE